MATAAIRPQDKKILEDGGRLKLEWDAYFNRIDNVVGGQAGIVGYHENGYTFTVTIPAAEGGNGIRVISESVSPGYHTGLGFLPTSGLRIGFLIFGAYPAGSPSSSAVHNAAGVTAFAEANWVEGSSYPTNVRIETTAAASTARTERFRIGASGSPYFPGATTTASAANAFLNSASTPVHELLRSTSSAKYKRDIEPLEDHYADAALQLEPVWYRSKAAADNPDWSWYGLIAEEVAKVDPRLVHWGYHDEDYTSEEVETESGPRIERNLKPDAELKPDGVMYDRLSVMLLSIGKRQEKRIASLEDRLAQLEARLAA